MYTCKIYAFVRRVRTSVQDICYPRTFAPTSSSRVGLGSMLGFVLGLELVSGLVLGWGLRLRGGHKRPWHLSGVAVVWDCTFQSVSVPEGGVVDANGRQSPTSFYRYCPVPCIVQPCEFVLHYPVLCFNYTWISLLWNSAARALSDNSLLLNTCDQNMKTVASCYEKYCRLKLVRLTNYEDVFTWILNQVTTTKRTVQNTANMLLYKHTVDAHNWHVKGSPK